MIAFNTRVDDGHVYHCSLDGEPLEGQPNATFGHRTDWWNHCSFCRGLIAANFVAWVNARLKGAA